MRPEDNNDITGRVGTPQVPQRSFVHTPPSRGIGDSHATHERQQNAATDLIRSQIQKIYDEDTTHTAEQPENRATNPEIQQQNIDVNPYERTLSTHRSIQADQWRHYHSAWQEYYKKYYEGYYTHHIQETKKQLELEAHAGQPEQERAPFGGSAQAADETAPEAHTEEPVTKQQAMRELRQNLIEKVQEAATKTRKSRHFVPIVAALAVVVVFVFLQYNQFLIANVRAYISPGSIEPQNLIVDPSATTDVGPEPRLIIPKINVDVPTVYGVRSDHESQMTAMESGVAHFAIPGANSHPGEVGNTVLSGHSSGDVFARGDYNFAFMQLHRLEVGDTIYANYEGTRYTYSVTKKEVVAPTQVNKLIYDTDKPVMTLITCTPLGTAINRLLITAEQVYPSPSSAAPAPQTDDNGDDNATIPGQNSPSLLERIFGA